MRHFLLTLLILSAYSFVDVTQPKSLKTAPSQVYIDSEVKAFNSNILSAESLTSVLAPPSIEIINNDCFAGTDGSINICTTCESGSSLEWSTNGLTWSSTVPTYDSENVIIVYARCTDDNDASCSSDPVVESTCPMCLYDDPDQIDGPADDALVNIYSQVFTCGADDLTDPVIGMSDAPDLSYASATLTPNKFDHPGWTLENLGNIYFVEFDNKGCIYAPASAFTEHVGIGSPAIQQFGSLGGSDAIYKLDAVTGAPSVWATIPTNGKGFGGITYDFKTMSMYVVNMDDYSIYQLNASGAVVDVYQPDLAELGIVNDFLENGSEITDFQNRPFGLDFNPVDGRLYYTVIDATGGGSMVVRSVTTDASGTIIPVSDTEEINFEMFHTDVPGVSASLADPVSGDIDFNLDGTMALGSWSSRTGNVSNYYTAEKASSIYNHTAGVYIYSETNCVWNQDAVTSVGQVGHDFIGTTASDPNATSTGGVAWDPNNPDVLWMSGGDFNGQDSDWGVIGYDVNQLDNVYDQEDATNYIQFLFEDQNSPDPKGNGGDVDVFTEYTVPLCCYCPDDNCFGISIMNN